MTLDQNKRAVGVFSTPEQAEYALNELRDSGFAMNTVSVVARDTSRQDEVAGVEVNPYRGGNEAGGGAAAGAIAGGAVGGLVGILGALSALAVPGFGPVLAGGAIASILGDAIIGGAVGAATGGIAGALMGLGIPEEQAKVYNHRVSQGDYLVIVEGTQEEINHAELILNRQGIQHWGVYDVSEVAAVPDNYGTSSSTPFDPISSTYPSPLGLDPLATGYSSSLGLNPLGAMSPVAYVPTEDDNDRDFSQHKRAVGAFLSRQDTEDALHELNNSGFPMSKVSVVARDADTQDQIAGVEVSDRVDDNNVDESATTGAIAGGALGGLTGLLVGLGVLAIPGVGPILLAGATATAIATTLAGSGIGAAAGGLIGALLGLGIPEDRAQVYNNLVARGDYLVMVDGTEDDVERAESVLSNRGIQEWAIYDVPRSPTSRTAPTDRSVEPQENLTAVNEIESQDKVTQVSDRVTIVDHRQ
ncbi:general stress protein [Coleofasciculus sp. FACHB-1120]|uniref:general stress protein n=1 Tax=Coleofasciculus sp. FACHB-1120 TaxID=2692783 RepID=UPI001684E8C2|nr:general stress protein [Coleofasciculus sp. FACHB-1120]MBD2743964.1 histidine kinase [Coleofasciculus sp. FACHB-1120]